LSAPASINLDRPICRAAFAAFALASFGYDWTKRVPWIVEAVRKNRVKQFVIDGEAVVLSVDGIADFNALHSRKHDHEVQLYSGNPASAKALASLPSTSSVPLCDNRKPGAI